MLAKVAGADELALTDEEAAELGRAMARMDRHLNVLQKVSPVWIDGAALASIMGGIYGPKFMAIKLRREAARAARPGTSSQAPPPVRSPSPNGAAAQPAGYNIPGVGPAVNLS